MNPKEIKNLDELLSQPIRNIYKNSLGHNLSSVYYQQLDRTLIIILEGTITSLENFLYSKNRKRLARNVRVSLDKILLPQIKNIIEQAVRVKVIDLLYDTTIESNFTGVMVIFDFNSRNIK